MKKIFFHGNNIFKKKSKKKNFGKSNFQRADSAFAVFAALVVLLSVSLLPCALCVLEKLKLQNFERKSQNFYSQLEEKNKEIEQDWKNSEAKKDEAD